MKKLYQIFRVVLFLLLVTTTGLAQGILDQKIDFSIDDQDIPASLRQLQKDADVEIVFSSRFFTSTAKRSMRVEEASIQEVLDELLTGTSIRPKVSNGRILLYKYKAPKLTLSGYVEDRETGERLISATVYNAALGVGTTTNEYGFFSLSVPPGEYEMRCQYLGYEDKHWTVNLSDNQQGVVGLAHHNYLTEVLVTPDSITNPLVVSASNRQYQLSDDLIQLMPGLGGQSDPLRSAHLLPGVQAGIDGLGGLQVRGGESGQNLMLLDGVPVYIPYHMLGVFSIFNTSTVQSTSLLTGNFSARYGGASSSILDVRTREGDRQKWHAEVGANLTNVDVLIEGPIAKDRTSLLFAGRYNYNDGLFRSMLNRMLFIPEDFEAESNYYDLNLKLNHQFSAKDRIYLSIYHGGDQLTHFSQPLNEESSEEIEIDLLWGNTISSLRWNHLFSDKLFANLTLTYSAYQYQYSNLFETFNLEEGEREALFFYQVQSNNNDIGLRYDLDYYLNPEHQLRGGIGLFVRSFVPVIAYFDTEDDIFENDEVDDIDDFEPFIEQPEIAAQEYYAYLEDQWKVSPNWTVDLGIRASAFWADETGYWNLEPRLSTTLKVSPALRLNAGYSRMIQYLHLVSSSALQLPTDLWIPSLSEVKPQSAQLWEVGFRYQINESLSYSMSAYHRRLSNLYALPDLTTTDELLVNALEDILLEGEGSVSGIETMLEYHQEDFGLVGSYVLSESTRAFEGFNEGEVFPFAFDSRHQLKMFAYKRLGTHVQLSANWYFASPIPEQYLAAAEVGNAVTNTALDPDAPKNEQRSIPYHRLDFNVGFFKEFGSTTHQFNFGIYNVYNRENVAFYELGELGNGNQSPVAAIGFTPSLSYRFRF